MAARSYCSNVPRPRGRRDRHLADLTNLSWEQTMQENDKWRGIVSSALDWEQAHARFDSAIADLPAELRTQRADRFPHSVWELVDHITRTQHDLLEFCSNPGYREPRWPDDYWPSPSSSPTAAEWNETVATYHRDVVALAELTMDVRRDLTEKIPHGSGQTYLRTILVAVDHASYHVGQIIAVRRLLGAWK
jgi:uncharacterized damage-inducible protein DinB